MHCNDFAIAEAYYGDKGINFDTSITHRIKKLIQANCPCNTISSFCHRSSGNYNVMKTSGCFLDRTKHETIFLKEKKQFSFSFDKKVKNLLRTKLILGHKSWTISVQGFEKKIVCSFLWVKTKIEHQLGDWKYNPWAWNFLEK